MPEDRSQQDIVYQSPATTNPVYHSDRDCPQTQDSAVVPVAREEIPDRYRECDRCRYSWVPTLDERATATLPWATALGALLIVLSLTLSILGGAL
jgi:hypothetical protein